MSSTAGAAVRFITFVLAAAFVPGLHAQPPGLSPARPAQPQSDAQSDFRPQIKLLASTLANEYFDQAVGARYARMIDANLLARRYDGLTASDLAKRLTADLKAVSSDKHLIVRDEGNRAIGGGPPALPPTIAAQSWIEPNVAYIKFNWFSGQPDSVRAVTKFMRDHRGAKTLIIDGREHRGGSLAEFNTLMGYLYARPTRLLIMDVSERSVARQGNPFEGGPAMHLVLGPKGIIRYENWANPNPDAQSFRQTKVYYLISRHTGSAGEHMALALKTTKRATLIGETTVGAGHFGSFISLGKGLEFDLPIGRTFDPKTGTDWEGVGVKPDIVVDPASALQIALALSHRR